jgi:hypothetical protein
MCYILDVSTDVLCPQLPLILANKIWKIFSIRNPIQGTYSAYWIVNVEKMVTFKQGGIKYFNFLESYDMIAFFILDFTAFCIVK